MSDSLPSPSGRSRVRLVGFVALAVVLVVGVVLLFRLVAGGPGEVEARETVEEYLDSLEANDCAHVGLLTQRLRDERDLDRASCLEAMEYEAGAYEEYSVLDVSVDGDRALVRCEDASDLVQTFTLTLLVVDGRWLIDDRRDDDGP